MTTGKGKLRHSAALVRFTTLASVICGGPLSTLIRLWHSLISLSDRRGEAEALYQSGCIYSDLGKVQKAAELLNRALSLWRNLKDRRGEALTLIAIGHLRSRLGEKQEASRPS